MTGTGTTVVLPGGTKWGQCKAQVGPQLCSDTSLYNRLFKIRLGPRRHQSCSVASSAHPLPVAIEVCFTFHFTLTGVSLGQPPERHGTVLLSFIQLHDEPAQIATSCPFIGQLATAATASEKMIRPCHSWCTCSWQDHLQSSSSSESIVRRWQATPHGNHRRPPVNICFTTCPCPSVLTQ